MFHILGIFDRGDDMPASLKSIIGGANLFASGSFHPRLFLISSVGSSQVILLCLDNNTSPSPTHACCHERKNTSQKEKGRELTILVSV